MEMVIEVSHPHPPTNPGRMSKLKHPIGGRGGAGFRWIEMEFY
jgi:hypothetical protein